MNMHSKTPASPSSQARSRKVRPSISTVAMSTLMLSTLGVAPFSVSIVRADGKTKVASVAGARARLAPKLQGTVLDVRVGQTLALAFSDDAKYSVTQGQTLVRTEVRDGLLLLDGLQTGEALLVVESPLQGTQRFILKMSDGSVQNAVVETGIEAASPAMSWANAANHQTAISQKVLSNQFLSSLIERRATPRASMNSFAQLSPLRISSAEEKVSQLPELMVPTRSIPSVPSFLDPMENVNAWPPSQAVPERVGPFGIVPLNSDNGGFSNANAVSANTETEAAPQISPNVPLTQNPPSGNAFYPTESPLPRDIARSVNDPSVNRPQLSVSQGMARVLAFKQNILAVFFSDENVMDARAINARTLAVTGKGRGRSTLAIFLARTPDDVVGRAVIYNLDVYSPNAAPVVASSNAFTDPLAAEEAITTALGDPRVRVNVIQQPNAGLVVRLSGALRDQAEIEAAKSTAALFVPNVISSLYAVNTAPTFDEAIGGSALTNEGILQSKLRNIFSNESIELVALPGSTALKATVNSAGEAEAILSLLPSLDRRIQPFIVIRGAPSGGLYNSENPVLYGEDYEMTRRLKEVTDISTVYVVRTARNALAIYGTVRNRTEYDKIRRYAVLLPQLQEALSSQTNTTTANAGAPGTLAAPISNASATTSVSAAAPALATANGTSTLNGLIGANAPASGYQFPTQIQFFVRMTDPNASAVRLVTVDSSVVEISRTALRDLGVQLGSVSLLSENVTPGTAGTSVSGPNGTTVTGATPPIVTREVDRTFTQGGFLGGNGFGGSGGFSSLNPVRARLTALMENGTAKILSKPNLTTIEGAEAQITVGGVRPIPSTQVSAGGGSSQTSVEFRRYGIILTMRPTVSDDDTILLQVRGDITDIDFTTAINLNGALIPGERVRSVDTTIAMREGDTLVMGGLITNESRKQTSRVPFLSQIPILGKLFQSKRFENNETELAIFLTPTIRRIQGSAGFFENFQANQGFPKLREEGRTTLDSTSVAGN